MVPAGTETVWLVLDNGGTAEAAYTADFRAGSLSLASVDPKTLPASGKVTIEIAGAGFTEACRVSVGNVAATDVRCLGDSRLVATIDCAKLAAGTKPALTVAKGAETKTLADALAVSTAAGEEKFFAKLSLPESVREGRLVQTCFVEYGNSGTADLPSPVLQLSMEGNGTLGYIGGIQGQKTLQFVAAGDAGSAGVLRPGEMHRIRFALRAGSNNKISLHSSVGSTYAPAPWTTAASYLADLSAAATRIALRGQDATDYALVFDLAKALKNGEATSAISGRVVNENGEVAKGFSVQLLDADTNTVAIVSTDEKGFFVFADVTPGGYAITSTSRISGGDGIAVANGEDVRNLVLIADTRVDCRLLVSGFTGGYSVSILNRVTHESIVPRDCGNDLFECRGLPYGCYVVNVCDSAGSIWRDVFLVDESGSVALLLAEPGESVEIRGRVEFQEEYDIKAVSITSPGFSDYFVLDESNEFAVTNLPAGYYSINIFCGDEDGKAISESEIFSGILCAGARTNIVAEMSGLSYSRNRPASNASRASFGDWIDRLVDPNAVKRAYLERLKEFTDLWYANRVVRPSGDYACVHNIEKYERDSEIWNSYVKFVQWYMDGANNTSMWQYISDWFWFGHKMFNMTFDVFIELYTRGKGSAWKLAVRDALFLVESYSVSEIAEAFEDADGNPVSEEDISAAYAALSAGKNASGKVNDAVTIWRTGQYAIQKLRGLRLRSSVSYTSKFMTKGAGKFLSGMSTVFTLGKDLIDTYDAGKKLWDSGNELQQSYDEMVYMTYLLDVNIRTFRKQAQTFNVYHLCPDKYAITVALPLIEIVAPFAPQSYDPNEMVGPAGTGTNRALDAGEGYEWTIYFENRTNATAAASEVRVTQALSPQLDWASFEMVEVSFGETTDIGLAGKANGTSETNLAGTNWTVRTEVALDATNGRATWYLRVVDPEGDEDGWPLDPTAGFLPPNDETHRGEGHITYRIKVKENATEGARIDASATIVFDYNDPIPTDPAWWNTVAWRSYAVKFNANGGTGTMADQRIKRDTATKLRANAFKKNGFTFLGWSKSKTGAVAYKNAASVKNLAAAGGSTTLYAQWAKNAYKVAFNANGGTLPEGKTMAAQPMTYGKAAKLRKNVFTRKDCTFLGWAKTKTGAVAYANAAAVKNLRTDGKTTTLYAKWAKTKYAVAFNANGGTGKMANQTMTYGKAATLTKNAFKRSGWTFLGWATSKTGAVAYKNAAEVKNLRTDGKTTTLYAKWAKNSYKVAFNANGGTGKMTAQAMTYGKAANLKKNAFKRTGYTFAGWAKTKTGAVAYKNAASVKNLRADGGTQTLFAKWAPTTYKVAFNANGGTGTMAAQSVKYDATAKLRANAFMRKGYTFAGWAKTKTGAVAYKNAANVKNLRSDGGTTTLYAVWTENPKAETSSGVPYAWLAGYGLGDGTATGYETAANAKAANGVNTGWECYVAGLDPKDGNAAFTAALSFDADGNPVVSSAPDFGDERTYTVEGVENLGDAWGPTNAATRFFRVKVGLRDE
jgi:uncharacterized repeat protein (TIGR02543 family)